MNVVATSPRPSSSAPEVVDDLYLNDVAAQWSLVAPPHLRERVRERIAAILLAAEQYDAAKAEQREAQRDLDRVADRLGRQYPYLSVAERERRLVGPHGRLLDAQARLDRINRILGRGPR